MTRDARLSALHRGDFRPGAALPSPALPPDPCSDAPRSQVVMQALAHTISNAVEAAYRRGDLFEKRRDLMNDWAAFCERPRRA